MKLDKVITYDELLVYNDKSKQKFADKTEIIKDTSKLNNDSNFQNATEVQNKINDSLEAYTKTEELPKNLSDFFNDQEYQTEHEVDEKITQALEGSGYQNAENVSSAIRDAATSGDWQSAEQVAAAINEAVKDFVGVKFEVVDTLPEPEGQAGVIYLKKADEDAENNVYSEFVWIQTDDGGKYEQFGSVNTPNLSDYLRVDAVSVCPKADILSMFPEE